MPLTSKYAELIHLLQVLNVDQLEIEERDDLLYISGIARSAEDQHKIWDLYNRIDPNYISNDLVLELNVHTREILKEALVNRNDEPSVAVRRGPSINQPIVAELHDGERVEILGITNQNWYLVKVSEQVQGYCYIDYLSV